MPQLDVTTPTLVARTGTVDGRELAYLSGGEGPTILVLHDDGPYAAQAYAGLALNYHILAVDVTAVSALAGEEDSLVLFQDLLKADGSADGNSLAGVIGAGAGAEPAERLAGKLSDLDALVLANVPDRFTPSAPTETPTLFLVGDDDSQEAVNAARIAAASYPSGALVFLYAAQTHLAAARPEAFADVVGDFLEHKIGFARVHKSGLINP